MHTLACDNYVDIHARGVLCFPEEARFLPSAKQITKTLAME
jgi:hypothetical protein